MEPGVLRGREKECTGGWLRGLRGEDDCTLGRAGTIEEQFEGRVGFWVDQKFLGRKVGLSIDRKFQERGDLL